MVALTQKRLIGGIVVIIIILTGLSVFIGRSNKPTSSKEQPLKTTGATVHEIPISSPALLSQTQPKVLAPSQQPAQPSETISNPTQNIPTATKQAIQPALPMSTPTSHHQTPKTIAPASVTATPTTTIQSPVKQKPHLTEASTKTIKKPTEKTTTHKKEKSASTQAVSKQWTIQIASFSELKNAKLLQQSLNKKGFKTYIRKATLKQTQTYRVYVGPQSKKEEAQALLKKLKKETGLKGIIKPFKLPAAH